ncbi:DNA protecting protein DprA [Desulfarculus baarsii DSM 2075]|uniref:DNA protecting protein DprA n=1 Tax=Desulfarculus baarsii (strain ATCC 33931 / DSM 2075 / LMG 7858 / VKM B-1802 / 2st14) TaxID=644282 RepID=E1QIS6_DESB2|nr:DNA-processing protein DprA [Desulfarculus baarsii]ADK84499.1 DNA protecting protein DprA [Desulfarculus baarsii DSM 2075]
MPMDLDNAALSREELLDWLGLRLIPGVGGVTFARLLDAFGRPGRALGAPLEALSAVPGLRRTLAEAISRRAWSEEPSLQLERLAEVGGRVITLADPEYPPLLANAFAPPPLLFVRGDLGPCREGGVAVVGSRNMTTYGQRMAAELGRDLARAGLSVISGLARGVDGQAHRAALEAGGHTVGVLGCGLDVAYPPEHAGLIERMAGQGAVVSEFPMGSPPAQANFPVRNRIIAGLSRAVVVVEAGLRSGALITARHALEENREVFAVPGLAGLASSAGCNELLRRNAAQLLESAQDILAPGALGRAPSPARPRALLSQDDGLLPEERALLALVGPEPTHVDQLIRRSGLDAQSVAHHLLNLELAERVRQLAGKRYELA